MVPGGIVRRSSAMREIRALLVDDEAIASEGLRFLLGAHSDVKIIGDCRDGDDAVKEIRRLGPDVVFLDVQMPSLDAFDMLAELVPERTPLIVFVTAYEDYALRAFDVQAADYLLKPVTEERLGRALDRVRRQMAAGSSPRLAPNSATGGSIAAAVPPTGATCDTVPGKPDSYLSRLIVRTGRRSVVIAVSDIDWIAADDYCVSLMTNARRHILRASLSSLESRLDPAMFARVHRSALVNVTRVKAWHEHSLRRLTLVLADSTRITVSRRRKAQLLEHLRGISTRCRD